MALHEIEPHGARDGRQHDHGLLQREARDQEVQPGAIPSVVERLIEEVDKRGLTEIGICRSFFFYGLYALSHLCA